MSSILALSLGLPVGAGLGYLVEQRRCPRVCYLLGRGVQGSLGRCYSRARNCSRLAFASSNDNNNNHDDNTPVYEDLEEEDGLVLFVRSSLSSSSNSVGEFLWKRIRGYAIVTWCGFAVFIYILWTHQLDGMTHHHHHHGNSNGTSSSYAFDDDSFDDNYEIPTDPSQTTNHHNNNNHNGDNMSSIILLKGLVLGCLSGILLGCGLMGSILNYQQIRVGDTHFPNSDLTVQLLVATRSETDSTVGRTNADLTSPLEEVEE